MNVQLRSRDHRRRLLAPVGSPILTGLQAYWKLDETSGTRIDSHGSNNLTDVNTVGSNTGIISNAADFVAANQEALTITDNAALSCADIDLTVWGWFYLNAVGIQFYGFFSKWDAGAGVGTLEYRLVFQNNVLFWQVSGNGSTSTSVTRGFSTATTWTFFCVQHDATNNLIKISLNNDAFTTAAHTTGIFNGVNDFQLGHFGNVAGTGHLNGRLDEIGFTKALLSADNITSLYNGGTGKTYPFT